MYTYYIHYEVLYRTAWEDWRRVLKLNRKVKSVRDIEFIQNQLESKHTGRDVKINSFSILDQSCDGVTHSVDEGLKIQ